MSDSMLVVVVDGSVFQCTTILLNLISTVVGLAQSVEYLTAQQVAGSIPGSGQYSGS